jgi:hypothetical protein
MPTQAGKLVKSQMINTCDKEPKALGFVEIAGHHALLPTDYLLPSAISHPLF